MGASKQIIPPDKWICTRKEIMDLFNIHWMTHQNRFISPGFPRDDVVLGTNRYNLKIYIDWLINVHYAASNNENMAKEKLRHEKYKADKAMYDAEERAKKLLPRDEIISGLSLLLSGTKNKFLGWIKRLPGLLAHKSVREIEPILQEELYIILFDLAKGIKIIIPKEKKEKTIPSLNSIKFEKIKPAIIKKRGRPKKIITVRRNDKLIKKNHE